MVASEPAWPLLKKSTSVRASMPRTSPMMIRSGLLRRADFKRVVERDVGLEHVSLAFHRQDVRFLDVNLGGAPDDNNDAILLRNEVSQYSQEHGFAASGPATDEQRLLAANLLRSANGRVRVPRAIGSSTVQCRLVNVLIVREGEGRTTGAITAASRLPSGSWAFKNGLSSS